MIKDPFHDMHCSEGVRKPSVVCTGIHYRRDPKLGDMSESLKLRGRYYFAYERESVQSDKVMDRISNADLLPDRPSLIF